MIRPPLELDRCTRQAVERHYEALVEKMAYEPLELEYSQLERIVSILTSHDVTWRHQLAQCAMALHRILEDNHTRLGDHARGVALAALVYLCDADDVVPDYTVGTGFIDDAHVMNTCLKILRRKAPDTYAILATTIEGHCR